MRAEETGMSIARALRGPVEARLEAIRADPASCFNLVSMYTGVPICLVVCVCAICLLAW